MQEEAPVAMVTGVDPSMIEDLLDGRENMLKAWSARPRGFADFLR